LKRAKACPLTQYAFCSFVPRYKASEFRQIDSRIHFLKSKLSDEEHKCVTLAFAAEDHAKDIIAKNSLIASLQQQNNEMKLSVAGTNIKMRMLDDEIQVRHVRCVCLNVP
jgi:hypothetical protein